MMPTPRIVETDAIIPVMAALPYEIAISDPEPGEDCVSYDPQNQVTLFAGRRDFSTCREDESVGGFLSKSKSDTKKDD